MTTSQRGDGCRVSVMPVVIPAIHLSNACPVAWARLARRCAVMCGAVERASLVSGVGRSAERLPGRYPVSVCVVCGETRGVRESPSRCDLGDGGLLGLGVRELVV